MHELQTEKKKKAKQQAKAKRTEEAAEAAATVEAEAEVAASRALMDASAGGGKDPLAFLDSDEDAGDDDGDFDDLL